MQQGKKVFFKNSPQISNNKNTIVFKNTFYFVLFSLLFYDRISSLGTNKKLYWVTNINFFVFGNKTEAFLRCLLFISN